MPFTPLNVDVTFRANDNPTPYIVNIHQVIDGDEGGLTEANNPAIEVISIQIAAKCQYPATIFR